MKHQISLLFLIFLTSWTFAQRTKLVTKEYVEKLMPQYGMASLDIKVNQQIPEAWIGVRNIGTKKKGMTKSKRPWRFNTLKDSSGLFYVDSGLVEIKIHLDSQIAIYYFDTLNLKAKEAKTVSYDFSKLNSLNPKNMISTLSNGDTLLWIQESDNNWFRETDSVTISMDAQHRYVLDWIHVKKGRTLVKEKLNTIIDAETLALLIKIEERFVYPAGTRKTKFEFCGSCRGTQSAHRLQLRNYKKVYIEPTCENDYWLDMRDKILKANK